ncbi:helix-turn-helix domain-containing protein [Avibacterium sp. 21-599]|uniref:helix-turn-helix domain-containing protein n=1 Tax=Avibacterium sp. 21-599 TaxID=2911528 RepID=UPI0022482EDA|nr:helix-turn-helix domain-containing protein [Avibacterium sp. 21-599]MCW9717363.1 helix-turn-helix domain-containing protein [Avibacterium sp. 21-599]
MSMLLMVKAMQCKVGNATRKLVLLKLADNSNDEGVCFPSYQHIADQCEITRRSAISHIEALIEMGWVEKKERKTKEGNTSNLYILHLKKASENSIPASENTSLGSENISPSPSENISPRTSHSINQSINLPSSSEKISDGGVGKKSRFKFSDDDMAAAQWIFGLILKLNPNTKKPPFESWANEIRLMRERDGRTHREICELFLWANQDSFWKANILSPAKLREKWDQLTVKKNNSKPLRKTVSELNAIEWNTEEGWRGML